MKKTINNLLKAFVIVLMITIAYSSEAQPPSPPGGQSGTGNDSGNSQGGGGAPIGGGLFILMGLAAAYGGRKIYNLRKEHLEE